MQGLAGVVDNSGTIKTYFYRKDAQGNIVALLDRNGAVVVKYVYNAWGEHKVLNPDGTENTSASFIGNINPFRYRGYYYDSALKLYYLVTRYYDPFVGRFISQDSFEYADPDTINGLNLYAYCNNNPVMATDEAGTMPNWLKWLIGGVVILGLGVAVVVTGGAAAGVAGFIVAGAFKGAVIGALSGALVSGTIGGITSAVNGNGFWDGFIDGAADGFMSGAIIGGITGAISSYVQVANAAKMWQAGTSTKTATPFKTMTHHYQKHVIEEGFKRGNNIVKYTKDAIAFANRNASVLKFQIPYKTGLQPFWTWVGKVGMNGQFTSAGKILTFWYAAL